MADQEEGWAAGVTTLERLPRHGIIANAFGAPSSIPSNMAIAAMTMMNAGRLHASIYTQADVLIEGAFDVTLTDESDEESRTTTLRMNRDAVRWAIDRGIMHLWIACAEPHYTRCRRDLEEAIKETRAPIQVLRCPEVFDQPPGTWFCAESTQRWTQSKLFWYLREWALLTLPFWIYRNKRVAG